MAFPEQWLKSAAEAAAGCPAYPMEAPEGASLPYLIYGRTSTTRETVMASTGAVITPYAQFRVILYGATYSAVKTMAANVVAALHNFNGAAHGVTIRQCLSLDELDGPTDYLDGQDRPTFSVEQTYQIRWEE